MRFGVLAGRQDADLETVAGRPEPDPQRARLAVRHDQGSQEDQIGQVAGGRKPVGDRGTQDDVDIGGSGQDGLAGRQTMLVEHPVRCRCDGRFEPGDTRLVLHPALEERIVGTLRHDRFAGALGRAGDGAGGHADFVPDAPMQCDCAPVAVARARFGIGVEIGVGGDVVDLTGRRRIGARR